MSKPDLHFEVDREPDDLEQLLAKPPITGKRIFADGVMDPYQHPELEAALERYHDDAVKWLKDTPGAAGKAKFMLAYAFGKAGHPLRAMPPSKQLIDAIWSRTCRLLNPAYAKACAAHEAIARRSRLPASLSPVLISNTIHGCRVLLENAEAITRKIVAESTGMSNLRPWKPGQSGNPSGLPGRPQGSANIYSSKFRADFLASWQKRGPGVLDRVATEQPAQYLGVAAKLCPQEVQLAIEARESPLDQHDMAILKACREAIPNVAGMTPEQTFEHALAALRAYGARTIEMAAIANNEPENPENESISDLK
jgi:hypothetical protein